MTDHDPITELETHERECAIRFSAIEQRLKAGSERMDRMENRLHNILMFVIGVYPFVLGSVFLAKLF